MKKNPDKDIAVRFIDAINDHDVGEIVDLMSEDHVFIDAYGNKSAGKTGMPNTSSR